MEAFGRGLITISISDASCRSMDASFQLGFELTNALNPLGQAVSALKSLGLIEAIKKSGSDAITEVRLASIIGRHRIDEAIEIHFREAVSKSGQSTISRYIDIVLEAGGGPTVQEALKNPALFSMVIQLSALAFSHQDESLANALVEATERIAQRSKRDADIGPDYVSILGTVRACRQQTASFHWATLYEAVERKIESALTKDEERRLESTTSDKRREKDNVPNTELASVTNRRLPFKILESLLVGILSLQSLEEHSVLHIKSDSGISTIVVWCHHVLGIGVSFRCRNVEVNFGNEPRNLIIETSAAKDVCAIMMHPADPHEPLFTLHADENDPIISYEHRFQAFGFGSRILMLEFVGEAELRHNWSHWIIARCLIRVRHLLPPSEAAKTKDPTGSKATSAAILLSANTVPSEATIINAAKFTFALEFVDADLVEKFTNSPSTKPMAVAVPRLDWPALVALVFVLSRIHPDDLERCGNLPLSLPAFEHLDQTHHGIKNSTQDHIEPIMTIPTSFHILCRLMLGASFSEDYIEHAVLVSSWGWSTFFGTIDALDPADVSACDIRLLQGVPARKGVRVSRIIDGPTNLIRSSTGQTICNKPHVMYFPGVSSSKRGELLVGHQSDAFSVTQSFKWKPERSALTLAIEPKGLSERKHKMGLRAMLELCADAGRFPPCECDSNARDPARYIEGMFQSPGLPKDFGKWRLLVGDRHIFNLNLEWPTPELLRKILRPDCSSTHGDQSGSMTSLNELDEGTNEIQERIEFFGELPGSIASLAELPEIILSRLAISDTSSSDSTRVREHSSKPRNWIFYVSENAAARWLQLDYMYHSCEEGLKIMIRGKSTCVECACKSPLLEELGPMLVLL